MQSTCPWVDREEKEFLGRSQRFLSDLLHYEIVGPRVARKRTEPRLSQTETG
jgi:hypothetical protein